jgi:hypothetical protein
MKEIYSKYRNTKEIHRWEGRGKSLGKTTG